MVLLGTKKVELLVPGCNFRRLLSPGDWEGGDLVRGDDRMGKASI